MLSFDDAEHFARVRPPKVLLTTCYKPSKIMYTFLSEMLVRGRFYSLRGARTKMMFCLTISAAWMVQCNGFALIQDAILFDCKVNA
eukprot:scaffold122242_cov22-Tisochrysis_lutea.AAC.3